MRRFYLAYFNFVDRRVYGIEFEVPPFGPNLTDVRSQVASPCGQCLDGQFGPVPGWLAVSVNFLKGLPFSLPPGDGTFGSGPVDGYGYFQLLDPEDKAGFWIFISWLTAAEANRVRQRLALLPVEQ